jgi:hypothetical protein
MRRLFAVMVVVGMLVGCGMERVPEAAAGKSVVGMDGGRMGWEFPAGFDRNALVRMEKVRGGVVVVTRSGALLRFDERLRLVGERVDGGYTCIGRDG